VGLLLAVTFYLDFADDSDLCGSCGQGVEAPTEKVEPSRPSVVDKHSITDCFMDRFDDVNE
jgi:hypothetical protein